MAGNDLLSYFFSDVCAWHLYDFKVQPWEFTYAVREIKRSYNPEMMELYEERKPVNYNHPALRCAYLHKYSIHAAAVRDFAAENREVIREALNDRYRVNVHVCCLGGGPGADVIGLSAEFCNLPESVSKNFKFTTIDYMSGWKYLCEDVFSVANPERHGRLGQFLRTRASHSFVTDDIRQPSEETVQMIRCADILSMVKFVSALDPKHVFRILKNVFLRMKPGALVIFLDIPDGRSYETAQAAADACGLREIGIPHKHEIYRNPYFDQVMYEERSHTEIDIAMKMWKKPEIYAMN